MTNASENPAWAVLEHAQSTVERRADPRAEAGPPGPGTRDPIDRLTGWASQPLVREALASGAVDQLRGKLDGLEGLLAVVPSPAEGGTFKVLVRGSMDGPAPLDEFEGHPVEFVDGIEPETLTRPVSSPPEAVHPEQLDRDPVLDRFAPEFSFGPGNAMLVRHGSDWFLCSVSFLFENEDTFYLSTAGHCLLERGAESSASDPEARADEIRLASQGTTWNTLFSPAFLPTATYVSLTPDDGYHPVAFAQQFAGDPLNDLGNDFGLIEVPSELEPFLRARVRVWNGPTGFDRPTTGEALYHYGHGANSPTVATQAGAGVALGADDGGPLTHSGPPCDPVAAVLPSEGGDSGSPIGTMAEPGGAAGRVRDEATTADGASAVLTHGIGVGAAGVHLGTPFTWGTDLECGLDLAESELGFRPALVTEGRFDG